MHTQNLRTHHTQHTQEHTPLCACLLFFSIYTHLTMNTHPNEHNTHKRKSLIKIILWPQLLHFQFTSTITNTIACPSASDNEHPYSSDYEHTSPWAQHPQEKITDKHFMGAPTFALSIHQYNN